VLSEFLAPAVAASGVAWLCLLLGLLAARGWDVAAYGGTRLMYGLVMAFAGLPASGFLATLFCGHALGLGREGWWLDKLCIHQSDEALKGEAIRAVPSFLGRSDRLVVLSSERYFERLWCCFELATFLAERSVEHVDIVPLWLAPWLLATMAMDFVCSLLANAIMTHVLYSLADAWGPTAGILAGSSLVVGASYAPAIPLIVLGYRLKTRARARTLEQLRAFSFAKTECSDEADRPRVEACVVRAYGSLAAFEARVRTDVAARLEARCGGARGRFPFALAALPFLPFAWTSGADVLSCDGTPCLDQARVLDLPAASTFVLANAIVWLQFMATAWTVYPFVFSALEFTEAARARWARDAGGALVVLAAFAGWGFVGAAGSLLVYRSLGRAPGAAPVALGVYLAGLAAWNAYLFRGRWRRPDS